MTVCTKCKYFKKRREGKMWYDQLCSSPSSIRSKTVDPVTGEKAYSALNSLGERYFTENKYPYARDLNDGGCAKFKRKFIVG